ncbi:MAG: hypothetical protein WC989_00645 [Micavibrio sp.]
MSAYHSISPKRNRPVSRDDFHLAAVDFSVDGISNPGLLGYETLENWERRVAIAPEAFASIFTANFTDPVSLAVDLYDDHLRVDVRSTEDDGKKFSGYAFLFAEDAMGWNVPESYFHVRKDSQGQGIGSQWLKSRIELGVALGESKMQFVAGDENGAHSWGRRGVHVDLDGERKAERHVCSRHYHHKLYAIKDFVGFNDYMYAAGLCAMQSATDMTELALGDIPVKPSLYEALCEPGSPVFSKLGEVYESEPVIGASPVLAVSCAREGMKKAFENAALRGKEPCLSQILATRGAGWPAVIDYGDRVQMEKIGAFLGGWNTISPA